MGAKSSENADKKSLFLTGSEGQREGEKDTSGKKPVFSAFTSFSLLSRR